VVDGGDGGGGGGGRGVGGKNHCLDNIRFNVIR
jgi:hypothetical protein